MALAGKLIGYVEISKTGDVFHDLFRHSPHKMVAMTPDKVHDCELHEGERGAVGSVITWHYTHGCAMLLCILSSSLFERAAAFFQNNLRALEGEKRNIARSYWISRLRLSTWRVQVHRGELVDELLKSFYLIILHVEQKGEGQWLS
ncbi:MLP-like protein 43 [Tanacetum coccineum]|uniref:MLP-like protein 43 n=1 Tax=Tanacetum coccineum TaxID=301880 RepID=A0ABQ5FMF6_9ASTR